MRKILLFIMLVLVADSAFCFVENEDILGYSKKRKEIVIKDVTGVPIFRSPIVSPLRVFIYDNVLIVNFKEPIGDVCIRIVDKETNETFFFYNYSSEMLDFINVDIDKIGEFEIYFTSAVYEAWGGFVIE